MARIVAVSATPTITASSAYTSGNALGGLLTFTDAATGGCSKIVSAEIFDKAGQKIAADLLLFTESVAATADKSAIAISSANLLKMVGAVSFVAGDYVSVGTGACATKGNLSIGAQATVDNNLYGQLVTRGTPTYASTSDITVKLVVELYSG